MHIFACIVFIGLLLFLKHWMTMKKHLLWLRLTLLPVRKKKNEEKHRKAGDRNGKHRNSDPSD